MTSLIYSFPKKDHKQEGSVSRGFYEPTNEDWVPLYHSGDIVRLKFKPLETLKVFVVIRAKKMYRCEYWVGNPVHGLMRHLDVNEDDIELVRKHNNGDTNGGSD